jgi:hyaluronoglucosaminidase
MRRVPIWGGIVLATLCLSLTASAQDFEVLWGASSGTPQDGESWATWRDWQALVDLGTTGIQRDHAVFLYQGDFGAYPNAGLQQVVMDPAWMTRHRAAILACVNTNIPNPNYSGLAIIDYEAWGFSWNFTTNVSNHSGGPFDSDTDFKDDWRDYIRQYRPWAVAGLADAQAEAVFASTYNEAARTFILNTIQYAKSLRPQAKWGFYAFPYRSYYDAQDPTAASIYEARMEQEFAWLYAEQNAFFPDIYSMYLTEGDEQTYLPFRDRETPYVNYVTYNIQWAVDAAQGRPVYPLVWMRYHENAGPFAGQFANSINMQYPLQIAQQMSVRGVVIWDTFGSTIQADRYQAFVDNQLRPFLRPFLGHCPADFDADQSVTIDDLVGFLTAFERGSLSADITSFGSATTSDFVVDIDDLLFFIQRFADGC